MNALEELDPYMPSYVHEKLTNPNASFQLRQFRANDVFFIDKILKFHKENGCGTMVKTDRDWQVVKQVFTWFIDRWPEEFKDFKESMQMIRQTRNLRGMSKSKEIQYVGALPPRFERIISRLFPENNFNKDFLYTLVKKMPIFKVAGEGN